MSEKVKIEDVCGNDVFGRALLGIITDAHPGADAIKVLGIGSDGSKEIDVELRINGIATPIRPFIDRLDQELDSLVNKEASKRILEKFKEQSDRINTMLFDAEHLLKEQLREAGLLFDREEY